MNDKKDLNKLFMTNPFDQYIKEVDKTHIPQEYVQSVTVKYNDGTRVELKGEDVYTDINLYYGNIGDFNGEPLKKIADVKVFVDTIKLESIINKEIDDLFARHDIL